MKNTSLGGSYKMVDATQVLKKTTKNFVQKESTTCTICDSTQIHHTYSNGKTVCKECYNFFQATVNKMMGIQS